jgi:hypothetical protein
MPPDTDDNRPDPIAGTTFFQQRWPITAGTIVITLSTNRVLLADEFIKVGKVMGEVERLAEMLADQSEATDADA